jgi:hypothetical protein
MRTEACRPKRIEHSRKQIELGPEADEWRNSGEREEEHKQNGGEQRIAFVQTKEGIELVAAGGALDDADDAECADGREAVGDDVVEDGLCAAFVQEKNASPSRM